MPPSDSVVKNVETQQVELRAAKGLAFEELDPVHLAFHLSLTVWGTERGGNRGIISAHAAYEADQLGDVAPGGSCQPRVEIRACPRADEGAEVCRDLLGCGNGRALRTQRGAEGLFLVVEILQRAQQEPTDLAG